MLRGSLSKSASERRRTMAASFQVQVQREGGEWITIIAGSFAFYHGYFEARRDSAGPSLATRIIDPDCKVRAEQAARLEVAIGLAAGSPTVEQLESAGARVLARAAALRAHQEREAARRA
jgi:hypothetical protein